MPKKKIEHQLLKEFCKLCCEGKGEVFAYTKWMRDIETRGRVRDWLIRYYPGKRAKEEIERVKVGEQLEFELPPLGDKETVEKGAELSVEESSMAEQLIQRGITGATARELVRAHPVEQIQMQIEVFDWLRESRSRLIGKNPAGFLRKSIEENYQPPEEYLDHRDREARKQKEKDRRERWLQHREELIQQDIADWDKTPPEERAKGRLDFWILQQKLNGLELTQEQIQENLCQLIDGLPQTEQEKREYLANQYPADPPEDFE